MNKRVISESINIRINVGNYQHIEITKQAQEEIEYETKEERLALEEDLSNDLISSVVASMRLVPQRLGKCIDNAQEVEDAISKAIPEWLENCPPNLANVPKANSNKVASEQKVNKDSFASLVSDIVADTEVSAVMENKEVETAESQLGSGEQLFGDGDIDDLFLDDESPAKSEAKEEVKESLSETVSVDKEEKKDTVVVAEGSDEFDFFDDDDCDLFND
jgi:hypothetical protein